MLPILMNLGITDKNNKNMKKINSESFNVESQIINVEELTKHICGKRVRFAHTWVDTDMFLRDGHEYRIIEKDGCQVLQKKRMYLKYV